METSSLDYRVCSLLVFSRKLFTDDLALWNGGMRMQTKLVLVEGNPFTGKSTLSEYAAQQIRLNGHAAEWVPEGLMLDKYFPHVLAVLDEMQPISEEVLWAEWNSFVQTVESAPATFVVDAAISYAAVYPLLAEDRPHAAILDMVTRVAELCAPLHPRVIHLMGDQDRIARASIAERGDKWEKQLVDQSDATPYQKARGRSGVEGAIAFLQETQELMDAVLVDDPPSRVVGLGKLGQQLGQGGAEPRERRAVDLAGDPQAGRRPHQRAEHARQDGAARGDARGRRRQDRGSVRGRPARHPRSRSLSTAPSPRRSKRLLPRFTPQRSRGGDSSDPFTGMSGGE